MDIKRVAYEKYQLHWMMIHGCSLWDLIQQLQLLQYEMDDNNISVESLFEDWEHGYSFDGEIWACYNEFLCSEFLDEKYMEFLLSDKELKEYKREYPNEVQAYSGSREW